VGSILGVTDGIECGSSVDLLVGLELGCATGPWDGCELGFIVGITLEMIVGKVEG
jgi:hypothetical protein